MSILSRIAFEWAVRSFGADHVTNKGIRALRTVEEAIELCQALGVPQDRVHKCVDMVYSRPTGEPQQELGGVLLTSYVLCETLGVEPEAIAEREICRVLAKAPQHFAARNQEKIAMGMTV